jgi:predicted Rossmann fold nucleotide-binding protein DprA/Smf involved in DNA uptake
MKLAIIGSRNCPPIDIEAQLKYIPDTIVSGGARGADAYAKLFAQKHNLNLIEYLPDYDKYGKGAPLVRNKLIVEACDCLMAFWDGKSRGTKFTLDYAKQLGKPIKIL